MLFEVSDVHYSYENVKALQGVSLRIEAGERVALLGANGSGKSTLLRLLAALSFPTSGSVSFCEEELTPAHLDNADFFFAFRRRVGLVFQNPDVQLFNPSVFDELAFGPLQLGWPKPQIRDRVSETLRLMDIAHLQDRPPYRLSGGEKKRVALASVLVMDPDVLLLDEPTAALDPGSAARMVEMLASWKNSSKTVIVATHDLDVLDNIVDRCCVMQNGLLVADETPLSLLHNIHLLEKTSLIRPHAHTHSQDKALPHPHVHKDETELL